MRHASSKRFITSRHLLLLVFWMGLIHRTVAQYELTVVAADSTSYDLGIAYRLYVEADNPTDKLLHVFGNEEKPLVISTPEGIFNSALNSSWNASGINPVFLDIFPDLVFDSFATIGLDGPAHTQSGAENPSLGGDPNAVNSVIEYFQLGGTEFEVSTLPGATWYVTDSSSNALPDSESRWLIAQVTTPGIISGKVNVEISIDLGGGAMTLVPLTYEFDGIGTFASNSIGCTLTFACNYSESAEYDDGSCEFESCVYGCTDPDGCNYNANTLVDNGTCEYPPDQFNCEGECVGDDCGCTEPQACNFHQEAIINDGSCVFEEGCGCTDQAACNYSEFAEVESGSCAYPDECGVCLNQSTGPGAIYDCGCQPIPEGLCDCYGNELDGCGVCGGDNSTCTGCTYEFACNFDESATILDVDACEFDCGGCTDPNACNFNPAIYPDDGSCDYDCVFGCTDELACNFSFEATENDNSCLYALGGFDCEGDCLNDEDVDGVCDEFEVPGCTDESACNFNQLATDEDGTCNYSSCIGCMDVNACNFDSAAIWNDSTYCNYPFDGFECDVTVFQVDMNQFEGPFGQVNLNGSFNGWCGSCMEMVDDDGDNVYHFGVSLPPGTYEYKFTLDGWSQQEMFDDGDPCTSTIDGFVNRTINIDDQTYLDVVCYNSCADCESTSGLAGCTDVLACNYSPQAVFDDGTCSYPDLQGSCDGDNNVAEAPCLLSNDSGLSYAPDFTATDINGVEHNLYDLLDQGYQVILLFEATWNGPGWSYYQQGIMEELYNTYGPDGTDEIRVFLLESDDSTTDADLNGTGSATQGDWVTGTSYPIIDNAGAIFDNYAGAYYPTLYTVCPNRFMVESGQVSVEEHVDIFQSNACGGATLPNDGALVGYAGETIACGDAPVFLEVILMNMGIDSLTSCTISASTDSAFVGSVDWSGSLASYECEQVLVAIDTIYQDSEFTLEITSPDDNSGNNVIPSISINRSVESTNLVRFSLNLDAYPGEVVWSLLNEAGDVEESGGPYESGNAGEEFFYDWTLDLGCYTFVIEDAYGDGLHASWYNGLGPDGAFSLDALWGGEEFFNLYSYSSPVEYSRIEFPFEVVEYNDSDIGGCLDESACNYLSFASFDDGTCDYLSCVLQPPTLSHVYDVNLAGNATLRWDDFTPVQNEELVGYEIGVFDQEGIQFNNTWHQVSVILDTVNTVSVYPTGWIMPSFLYDANEEPHCFSAVQVTQQDGIQFTSERSAFLCSIHLDANVWGNSGLVEYTWNSPYLLSGDSAGGPFILERRPSNGGQWFTVSEITDSYEGGVFIDSLLDASEEMLYRIRQIARNGIGEHVSNVVEISLAQSGSGGCTDENAWNYTSEAEYDDGSCEYFSSSCEFIGDSTWQGLELGVYPEEGLTHFVADTVFQELVVNVPPLVQEPTTGSNVTTMSLTNLEFNGMPSGLEFDVVPDTVSASSQECVSYLGQPYEPGEYEVELMGDLTVSLFGSPYVIEDFSTPFTITVFENPDPIYGCTYALASNYFMFAAVDDGSCVFAGCTDPEANNFEKFATEDDGSCDFSPCIPDCLTDLDQDGITTTSDLLLFLGEFGESCD